MEFEINEIIAVEQGHPVFLEKHLEYLNHTLESMGITQSVDMHEVCDFLKAQEDCSHKALKITVTAEGKQFSVFENPYKNDQYETGFTLDYADGKQTKAAGIDELILVNSDGMLCQGTTCNLFFVKNGTIYTPPVSSEVIPGIMREYVFEQFPVTEKILRKEDAEGMEGCFVTGSLMGIMPVTALGEKKFAINKTAQWLRKQYLKELSSL